MKTSTILIVAVLAGGGYWLYRRGQAQLNATTGTTGNTGIVPPGFVPTVISGVNGVIADVKAARPNTTKGAPATASTPTEASKDPLLTQTAPTHSTRRLVQAAIGQKPLTARELRSVGVMG